MKSCLFIFISLICCTCNGSCGYALSPTGDGNQNPDNLLIDDNHTFFELPQWIQIAFILALIAGFLAAIKFFPLLAGRIRSVLENDKRREILDYIFENPGRCFEEIALEMDLNRDSLRYHIKRLRQANYVVIENTDNSKRIFPNHGTFSDLERKIISICRNPMQLKIIALITKYPGIRNIDLKEELRISRSAVSWHIGKLEKASPPGNRERRDIIT